MGEGATSYTSTHESADAWAERPVQVSSHAYVATRAGGSTPPGGRAGLQKRGGKEEAKKIRGSKTYDTGVSRLVTHASTKPSSRMLNFEVLMDLGAFTLIWSYDVRHYCPAYTCTA